jgi:hypothetical protein
LVSADECETDRRKSKASIEEKLQVAACLLGALLLGSLAPALVRWSVNQESTIRVLIWGTALGCTVAIHLLGHLVEEIT